MPIFYYGSVKLHIPDGVSYVACVNEHTIEWHICDIRKCGRYLITCIENKLMYREEQPFGEL